MKTEYWMMTIITLAAFVLTGCKLMGPIAGPSNDQPPPNAGQKFADIYTIKVDGTNFLRLTSDRKSFYPRYSPDGAKILFLTFPALGVDLGSLYQMNSDGTGRDVLATDACSNGGEGRTRFFSQSHDSSRIAYMKEGANLAE